MGPILFIAYTADLASVVPEGKIVSYADDAAILVSGRNLEDLKVKIEACLTGVQQWYTANGLLINPSKTEFMVLGRNNSLEIIVNENGEDIAILSKKSMKVLGVTIDQKLSWEQHINQIKFRTSNAIRNIHRTANILPLQSRKLLNEALVTPHYNYCDTIYDGCSEKAKKSLQVNHNYAAKALLGWKRRSSATAALKQLKWLPLAERRKLHMGVFVHKALHGKTSKHGVDIVKAVLPQHGHCTRQVANKILYNKTHTSKQYERSVSYRAAKIWNQIPLKLKSLRTATDLKNKWQGSLIDEFLYK